MATLLLCSAAAGSLSAQEQAPEQQWKNNPRELVRRAVANEDKASSDKMYFMYRDMKLNSKTGKTETREMVQTPQLVLARVIAIDGHPLSSEAEAKEDARLNRLNANPDELAKKMRQQKADDARARKMVAAIPDAFNFQYVNTVKREDGSVVVMQFKPDPNWEPPDRERQVFTGMEGTLEIAVPQERIALMNARLVKTVEFGWGIFGKLYPGGNFLIEQHEVYPGYWDTTHMQLHFTGKVLLFKSLNIQQDEKTSDYQPVDGMTVAQALDKLKMAGEEYAKNADGK